MRMKINLNEHKIIKAVSIHRNGFLLFSLAIFLSMLSFLGQAQNPSDLIYQKDSLKADLVDLKNTLYESHENPFFYVDSTAFELAFDSIYQSINKDINLAEYGVKVSSLLQLLKDSHTTLNLPRFFNFTRANEALNLYFITSRIGNDLILRKDYLDSIPSGAVITSINGVSSEKILKDVEPYYFYEGNSLAQAPIILAGIAPKIVALNYGVELLNEIEFSYNGVLKRIDYPGVTYKTIKKDKRSDSPNPYKLETEAGTAFLKIGSFSAKSDRYYERFLRKSFKKIQNQKTDSLVIDLRDNLGGSVWRMEELFTYLSGPDVLSPYSVSMVKSPLSSLKYEKLTKGIGGWIRVHFYKNNDKMRVFREVASTPLHQRDTFIYKVYSEKKKHAFHGTKTLFINHFSGSASVLFTSQFKSLGFGKTMGTPCLGPYGGTWGDSTPYFLKRSGLLVNISVLKLHLNTLKESSPESIQPDEYYSTTIDDLLQNIDGLKRYYISKKAN